MALDPQARAVLDLIIKAGRPAWHTLSPVEARQQYLETRGALQAAAPEVALVRDIMVPGPHGAIPVRYYRPLGSQATAALPVLVYFHGGGWVIGDLNTHDIICRNLANQSGAAVISVDYRMGPEHKFPAAVDDAFAVVRWTADQGDSLSLDTSRLAVGGDSAGGNLAAVCCLLAREQGPALTFQLLIYPATDMVMETESHRAFGEGYMLTRVGMDWFQDQYLNSSADTLDWRASPLRAADLSNLPPALVLTAGFDPLRDEGKAYADRLAAAGVAVEYVCYDGMIHGFFAMNGAIDAARRGHTQAAQALARAFAGGGAAGRQQREGVRG